MRKNFVLLVFMFVVFSITVSLVANNGHSEGGNLTTEYASEAMCYNYAEKIRSDVKDSITAEEFILYSEFIQNLPGEIVEILSELPFNALNIYDFINIKLCCLCD